MYVLNRVILPILTGSREANCKSCNLVSYLSTHWLIIIARLCFCCFLAFYRKKLCRFTRIKTLLLPLIHFSAFFFFYNSSHLSSWVRTQKIDNKRVNSILAEIFLSKITSMIYTSNCILSKVVSSKKMMSSTVGLLSSKVPSKSGARPAVDSIAPPFPSSPNPSPPPFKTRLRVIMRFSHSVDWETPFPSFTSGLFARVVFYSITDPHACRSILRESPAIPGL